jgi:hypothetical protein
MTSITHKTHSWHCHSSVDGKGAHTTWTQQQIKDGVLGGQSIHTWLKGKLHTSCHWSSNHVCQNQCQLIPSNASQLYITIENKFFITSDLCKWQINVHKHAGVRKYSPPLTELCMSSAWTRIWKHSPASTATNSWRPTWVDTHRLGETDNGNKTVTLLTLRHTEVGLCLLTMPLMVLANRVKLRTEHW